MNQKIAYIIILIVLIAGIAGMVFVTVGSDIGNWISSPAQSGSTEIQDGSGDLPIAADVNGGESIVAGNDDAPLNIEACLPLSVKCHKKTTEFITKLAQDHPKLIRAKVVDMNSRAGAAMQRKYKTKCATIFFNGKSKLKLAMGEGGGTDEEVYFSGPLDAGYTTKHIALAAQQVLKELKGNALEVPDLTSQANENEDENE